MDDNDVMSPQADNEVHHQSAELAVKYTTIENSM